MKLKLLVAAAASAFAINASAVVIEDWGTHDTLEVVAVLNAPGAFEDDILFSLPSILDVSSVAVANNLLTVTNIDDGMVSLYMEAGAVDTLIGTYSFDGTTGSTAHTFPALDPGDYYYRVTGEATGSEGGFYSLTSHVVPEPETYAMLLAGLAVVGSLYRRRQRG